MWSICFISYFNLGRFAFARDDGYDRGLANLSTLPLLTPAFLC